MTEILREENEKLRLTTVESRIRSLVAVREQRKTESPVIHDFAALLDVVDALRAERATLQRELQEANAKLESLFTTPEGEAIIMVNIARQWTPEQRERIGLWLLGEDWQGLAAKLEAAEKALKHEKKMYAELLMSFRWEMKRVCQAALKLPRPWMDGSIEFDEWIAAVDKICDTLTELRKESR